MKIQSIFNTIVHLYIEKWKKEALVSVSPVKYKSFIVKKTFERCSESKKYKIYIYKWKNVTEKPNIKLPFWCWIRLADALPSQELSCYGTADSAGICVYITQLKLLIETIERTVIQYFSLINHIVIQRQALYKPKVAFWAIYISALIPLPWQSVMRCWWYCLTFRPCFIPSLTSDSWRNLRMILVKSVEIRSYLPFSGWFKTNQNPVTRIKV